MIAAKLKGRNLFQVRYIRLSYRIRGRVARIHTNIVAIIIVFKISCVSNINSIDPINRAHVNILINKIFIYSAMKIRANMPALYSTLNPDTNSDSPSAKSNGVRFVSAKLVINHIINKGRIISMGQVSDFIIFKSIDLWIRRTDKIIRAIDTSYEIVWATPRNAPNKAYLELEHHPAINVYIHLFLIRIRSKECRI